MLFSVCYDITDNKRRLKVAKVLADYGKRVQYSVFEADLDVKQMEQLKKRVEKKILSEEDSVRIYPICASCRENIEIIGQGTVSEDPEFIII